MIKGIASEKELLEWIDSGGSNSAEGSLQQGWIATK